MERRDKKLPRDTDPFVRAVFEALGPTACPFLLEDPAVQEHLTPVADRAIGERPGWHWCSPLR